MAFVLLAGRGADRRRAPRLIGAALVGAVVFAGVLLVLHLVSPAGMGFGDVKLGLLLGLYLGSIRLSLVVWGLLLGSLIGAVMAMPVAVRARDRRACIPFGPALAAGRSSPSCSADRADRTPAPTSGSAPGTLATGTGTLDADAALPDRR